MNENNILSFAIIFTFVSVYVAYKNLEEKTEYFEYQKLKLHLLSKSKLATIKKPIMWIPIPFEYNSRKWKSFGSRNNNDLNMDVLYLTVRTIVKNCNESFHIVLIDDTSYDKLIPGWNIDLGGIPSPIKEQVSFLAQMKLLYCYGGMLVPANFVCKYDLYNIYNKHCIEQNKVQYAEVLYEKPAISFVGSKKNSLDLKKIINHLEILVSSNTTEEPWFNKKINNYFMDYAMKVNENIYGIHDVNNVRIPVEDLMSEDSMNIKLHHNCYGLFIPISQIMKRSAYNWLIYLETDEIIRVNNFICGYIRDAL